MSLHVQPGAKIFYGDGRVYPDDFQAGEDPPTRGVQVILQKDPVKGGWYLQHTGDYYIKKGEVWASADIFGLFDYLMDSGLVLFGRTLANDEFEAIRKKAREVQIARNQPCSGGRAKPK